MLHHLLGRFGSPHVGHRNIEDGHVGLVFDGEANSFAARARLSHHFHVGLTVDQRAKPVTQNGMVVGDENAQSSHHGIR